MITKHIYFGLAFYDLIGLGDSTVGAFWRAYVNIIISQFLKTEKRTNRLFASQGDYNIISLLGHHSPLKVHLYL